MKCCFCGKELKDYGNFATPIFNGNHRCCDECNKNIIMSIRHMENFGEKQEIIDKINDYIEKHKIESFKIIDLNEME